MKVPRLPVGCGPREPGVGEAAAPCADLRAGLVGLRFVSISPAPAGSQDLEFLSPPGIGLQAWKGNSSPYP